MISILISLLLSPASAQNAEPFECSTFQPCLEQNDIFMQSTCMSLTNSTLIAICNCYAKVNRNYCFNQCPNDENVKIAEAAFQSELTVACAAVNLDPKALPKAPWDRFTATTTSSATGTTTSVTQTKPSSTTVIPASNSANSLTNIGIAFAAFLAMFFAI
jgi:hypothetical protein